MTMLSLIISGARQRSFRSFSRKASMNINRRTQHHESSSLSPSVSLSLIRPSCLTVITPQHSQQQRIRQFSAANHSDKNHSSQSSKQKKLNHHNHNHNHHHHHQRKSNNNNPQQFKPRQSLPEFNQEVRRLNQTVVSQLPDIPLKAFQNEYEFWFALEDDTIQQQRHKLYESTTQLAQELGQAVTSGRINPSDRYGRDVSALIAMLMQFYSASRVPPTVTDSGSSDKAKATPSRSSAFAQCQKLLDCLDQWNLNRHEAHTHYTMLCAVHESEWEAAADLFRQQFEAGLVPNQTVSVTSPVGLLSIVRAAQQSNTAVVEPVMDAVLHHLALTSPSDQDNYVLAAGTALGFAGESEALVHYMENSYNASSLGQSLVAAAMHACILCQRPDEALRVYRTMLDGNLAISSEFHWGGGQHQVLPLCRDLAMRAMGEAGYENVSTEALALLRQTLADELAVSDEALIGVFGACEHDSNWQGAMDALFLLLDDASQTLHIVQGGELNIPDVPDLQMKGEIKGSACSLERTKVVSSVMRTCNASQHHGLAILSYLLVDATSPGSPLAGKDVKGPENLLSYGPIEQTFLPFLATENYDPELLCALMTSLCRVECYYEAQSMVDIVINEKTKEGVSESHIDDLYADAQRIKEYSLSSCVAEHHNERRWDSAHRHIHRIVKAIQIAKSQKTPLAQDQLEILSSALGAAVRSCTFARQPEAGIVFSEYVKMELSRLQPKPEKQSIFRDSSADAPDRNLLLSDTLLSEEMKAYQASHKFDVAMDFFRSHVETDDGTLIQWTQSCNAAMSILAEQDQLEDAGALYQRLLSASSDHIIPDSMIVAATNYARAGRWTEVSDVYHMAVAKGFVSETLAILAMEAVVKLDMTGKLPLLREIINDVSQSSGSSPMVWMEDHYFQLKYQLGFQDVRLLMWWNDPTTCHLDELQFAIEVFEKKLEEGLRPKNQALRVIVANAQAFGEGYIPDGKTGIGRVPRDRESWLKLLHRVLGASHELDHDPRFIDEAAKALKNLGCDEECLEYVEAAMDRGVRLQRAALVSAVEAGNTTDMEDRTFPFRLLLA